MQVDGGEGWGNMKLWDRLIPLVFPGSPTEFRCARKIHNSEIRVYRWRFQYIAGVLCFFVPLIYLFFTLEGWLFRCLLVVVGIGEVLIRDTLSEHYCLLLHRLGYSKVDGA
jgi:hypothetical protein